MRTRKSPKNQERLWRALGGPLVRIARRPVQEVAAEHKQADAACGREWECSCASCNIARREDEMTEKMRGFYAQ